MSLEDMKQRLTEEKDKAREKIKNLGLPIPNKPEIIKDLQMPQNLSALADNKIDEVYDHYTLALQWSEYHKAELETDIGVITYNRDMLLEVEMASIGSVLRKDLARAEAIKKNPEIKEWEEMLNINMITLGLVQGLIKGYRSALQRIESEKIERASKRKHGG